MRLKRIAALSDRLLGDLETSLTAPVKIKKIGNVKDSIAQLSVTEAFFDEGLSLLGVGGSELVVNPITPGFSGINVSHLIANGHDLDEPISSHWLVKWGRPLSKVAQEAVAHRRALARGMPRNLLIPQLNPNAVCWRSIGFLVYAFEQNAETMYERLRKSKISETESFISKICDSLYATSRRKAISMREEIDKWCGSPDSTSAIDCPDNACEVTWSLIHGDLHLRNIFVHGEAPTLIDFARSDFGPVAIDCAKLTIDTLFFGLSEDDDLPNELTWQALKSSSLGLIINSFGAILRLPGDETLFVLACKHFAQRYCAYPDVPQSKKNYVSSLLKIR